MNNTNYIGSVVKILETPKQTILNNKISRVQFRVQFPQVRQNSIVSLTFWGALANEVVSYYKINDYLLIEGYVSLNEKNNLQSTKNKSKKIEITVLKVYPFLLSHDNFSRSSLKY